VVDENLKQAAVLTALNDMTKRGHFNVITLEKCADILGTPCKGLDSYKILSALHCVNFIDMPFIVRESIPRLVHDCLGINIEFSDQYTESWTKNIITLLGKPQ
jgi:hypothetical protein